MRRKTKESRSYDKFIAFLAPEEIDDCLRLQSLLKDTSKSTLVRGIVARFISNNNWDVEDLTDRYARHLYSQWDTRWREQIKFDQYIRDHKAFLKKAKLPDRLIKRILELCEEQHSRNLSMTK